MWLLQNGFSSDFAASIPMVALKGAFGDAGLLKLTGRRCNIPFQSAWRLRHGRSTGCAARSESRLFPRENLCFELELQQMSKSAN